MSGRLTRLAPWAIGCLCVLSGCADTASGVRKLVTRPFTPTPEEVLGIKTPKDRVKELRKLAKQASKQGEAEQEKTIAVLAKDFTEESDPWLRREVLRTLSCYPQRGAGAVLVTALGDNDALTRRTACDGLGKRSDSIAVQELARVLASDTDVDVRLAAAKALGATGDQAALGPLADALADSDPAMQAQSQRSLIAISKRDYGHNVQAWREFAQTGKSEATEISFSEKLRRTFY